MNVSDLELFKKSKIIEIGSVEKSYSSLKLAKFRKISEILDFRTVKSGFAFQNCSRFSKILEIAKKFFILYSFSFCDLVIIFGML